MWAPGPAELCCHVVPAVLVGVVTSGSGTSMPLHCLVTLSKQLSDRLLRVCHPVTVSGWACALRHLTAVFCLCVCVAVPVMVSDSCCTQVCTCSCARLCASCHV